jgi:hypothetical protein
MNVGVTVVEFISASTAGVVNLELGFQPDAVIHIQDHGGTNPNIRIWANVAEFPGWAAALSLLVTGSTGVITRVTTGITVFAGGTTLAAAETENSDPKHVSLEGAARATFRGAAISATNNYVTSQGLTLAAALQTNSGRNLVIAFRSNQ